MTEFKVLDNGIELFYSNLQVLEDNEFEVTVRAEKWNPNMARYEGLDVIIPKKRIENIEYLKPSQIDEFVDSVVCNQEEIIELAKADSLLNEGDNLIEFDSEKNNKEKSDKKLERLSNLLIEEMDSNKLSEENDSIQNDLDTTAELSFFEKLIKKLSF